MIEWLLSATLVLSATFAAFSSNMKRTVLMLWVMGLALGCLFLAEGAEFLAILQWTFSTGVAILFVFFSLLFGEWTSEVEKPSIKMLSRICASALVGVFFGVLIWVGADQFLLHQSVSMQSSTSLGELGKSLMNEHVLSFEIFVWMVLFVIVGSGIVARLESRSK